MNLVFDSQVKKGFGQEPVGQKARSVSSHITDVICECKYFPEIFQGLVFVIGEKAADAILGARTQARDIVALCSARKT